MLKDIGSIQRFSFFVLLPGNPKFGRYIAESFSFFVLLQERDNLRKKEECVLVSLCCYAEPVVDDGSYKLF